MLQTGYIHKYIRYNHSVIHKNMPPLFYDNFGKRPILKKDFTDKFSNQLKNYKVIIEIK